MNKIIVGFDGTDQPGTRFVSVRRCARVERRADRRLGDRVAPRGRAGRPEGYNEARRRTTSTSSSRLARARRARVRSPRAAGHRCPRPHGHRRAGGRRSGGDRLHPPRRIRPGARRNGRGAAISGGAVRGSGRAARLERRAHAEIGLIGVGYDGSAEADLALAAAEQLAAAFGATLRVITVAPHIGIPGEDAAAGDSPPGLDGDPRQGLEVDLGPHRDRARNAPGP